MEFKTLGISAPLLKALHDEAYEMATPIQEKAIPAALEKRDILGIAQTGTGKTAAFAVPILQILSEQTQNKGRRQIKSLVLTPTRELAIQIQESFAIYGRYLPLKTTVIFGGVGQGNQVKALKAGVDVLIATPGRLTDLISQGYINLSSIEIFVLDEADRMLDMGFIHEINRIIKLLPSKKQTMFFSATMPKEITEIVNKLLHNPVEISIAPASSTVDIVEQSVYFVDTNHKMDLLVDILKMNGFEQVLIFTRTKHGADKVVRKLMKHKIVAQAIHGNKSQNARQKALENFKTKKTQVLVATDIASRGIDISELHYVINYDLPEVPETYVHRIGRTGRAGKTGIAVSLCNFQDKGLLNDIEKLIRKKIEMIDNAKYPMVDMTPRKIKQQVQKKPKAKKDSMQKESKENRTGQHKNKSRQRKRNTGVK